MAFFEIIELNSYPNIFTKFPKSQVPLQLRLKNHKGMNAYYQAAERKEKEKKQQEKQEKAGEKGC